MENIIKKETILDKCFEQDFPDERPDTYMETIYKKGFEAGLNELKKYFEGQRLVAEINRSNHANHYNVHIWKIDELLTEQV